MQCSKCGKNLEERETVFQVRMGHLEKEKVVVAHQESEDEFIADSDVGYYCSGCLSEGV